jgi:condensin complex subunit 1
VKASLLLICVAAVQAYVHCSTAAGSSTCACAHIKHNKRQHNTTRTADALLDVLEERVRDSSSYTRAAVLRAWCSLCERGALPHARILAAAKLGAARLRDKSALVRRAAVQLLGALLERNPYTGSLEPEPYSARCAVLEEQLAALPQPPLLTAEESAALAELEGSSGDAATVDAATDADGDADGDVVADESSSEQDSAAEDDSDSSSDDDEAGSPSSKTQLKKAKKANKAAASTTATTTATEEQEEGQLSPEAAARAVVLRELTYCRGALAFIEVYEGSSSSGSAATATVSGGAAAQMCSMLQSRSVSDVTEALRFFVKARAFSLPCAAAGVRKSLALIWHAEPSVRDEVTKAFVEVFITPATAAAAAAGTAAAADDDDHEAEDASASSAALRVAHNLVVLVAQSSLAELASLEEVVGGLVKNGTLSPAVFEQLWTAAGAREQAGWARAAALQALALGAGALPELAEDADRLQLIATTALGTCVCMFK